MSTTPQIFGDHLAAFKNDQATPWGRLRYSIAAANLRRHLPTRSLSFLDAGGGIGLDAIPFAIQGHQITLLDYSFEMLVEARRNAEASAVTKQMSFLQSDVAAIPTLFSESPFDVILCHNVIQYVDDVAASLEAMCHALKPGGLISLLSVNRYSEPLKVSCQNLDLEAAYASLDSSEIRMVTIGVNAHCYTSEEMCQRLSEVGCSVIGEYGIRCVCDYILLKEGFVRVDGIKVGPYLGLPRIREIRRELSSLPMDLHASRLMPLPRLQEYLEVTGSQTASFHIALVSPLHVMLATKFRWYLPVPSTNGTIAGFCRQLQQLAATLSVPVLLENMPSPPVQPAPFLMEIDPACITQVLETTGAGFLLDLAHAQVAAEALGIRVEDYLTQLPLDRVVQIHVSGPRRRWGHLVDAHEVMSEADYALLEWILARTRPRWVTLEYFRERESLREQLVRLRTMLER